MPKIIRVYNQGKGRTKARVDKSPQTMANTLPSSESIKHMDWCCGIHGAARWRRGAKRGTSAARRRLEKDEIRASQAAESFSTCEMTD